MIGARWQSAPFLFESRTAFFPISIMNASLYALVSLVDQFCEVLSCAAGCTASVCREILVLLKEVRLRVPLQAMAVRLCSCRLISSCVQCMVVSHLCHCPGDPSQAQSVSQKAVQLACLSIGCLFVKDCALVLLECWVVLLRKGSVSSLAVGFWTTCSSCDCE